MQGSFEAIKNSLTRYFSPAKNLSRIKLFFNKEKVRKKGEVSYKVAFKLEIERTDKNSPAADSTEK